MPILFVCLFTCFQLFLAEHEINRLTTTNMDINNNTVVQSAATSSSVLSFAEVSPSLAPNPQLENTQLVSDQQKHVHLITWSQADDLLLSDPDNPRESFGHLVTGLFNSKKQNVQYWACSQEQHRMGGHHYHISIKFQNKMRWKQISNTLADMGIHVNFQSFHTSYKDAFQYVTKEDASYVKSDNHPTMIMIPPKSMQPKPMKRPLQFPSHDRSSSFLQSTPTPLTNHIPSCSQETDSFLQSTPNPPTTTTPNSDSNPCSAASGSTSKQVRKDKLNNIQVAQILTDNNVKTDLELCHLSKKLLDNNQPQLSNWVMDHPNEKYRLDVVKTAWKMHGSEKEIEKRNTPRLAKLRAHLNAEHAEDIENGIQCRGRWLQAAVEILRSNEISIDMWQGHLIRCLQFGRNKKKTYFLLEAAIAANPSFCALSLSFLIHSATHPKVLLIGLGPRIKRSFFSTIFGIRRSIRGQINSSTGKTC